MFRPVSIPNLSRKAFAVALAGLITIAHAPVVGADPEDTDLQQELDDPERGFEMLEQPGYHIIPLHEAAELATERFRGRLIAARLRPPRPEERERGVDLVHELRLLTPGRDVLLIRLDARTGAFLEVRGAGLAEARRKHGDNE